MPRVNRTFVFVLLLASSCAFLLFQLYYYRNYVSKEPGLHLLDPAGHVMSSQVQWQNLKKFLALAQFFRLPLFLADSAALALLSQDALRQRDRAMHEPHCSFLCAGRPITSFALPASQWQLSPGFLLAAEQKGFQLLEVRGRDPRLASLDTLSGEEIPLHFLFRLHGYIIHVVLLYERSGGYLWHGALRLKATADPTFAPFRLLDYGRHAGAYDRPELLLTVVDGLDVRVPRNISRFLVQRQEARFLECRYHDARSFLQLYPDDSSAAAVEFRRKAKVLLRLAAQTLGRLDIPFWISSGTCLGWYRQCGVISYSRDVDIGIFISDFRPQITTAFRDAGMSLKHQFGKVEDSLELSFLGEDVKLDIFFFYRDGDVVWNGGTQAKSGRKFKYVFPSFSLCWAELLEVKVRVPCETLDYVMANYGGTWSVPVKSWDWKSSPSNVIENGVWPVAEWAGLIQVY
ncbi:PREDICTED: fukutin isoform X1 [Poecilia mexicana]|uniref:Ribitol-5-phosphate transferase FKTN N-terminal domain-containing protein n=1 Tax=Poecilia mexicana TaxID=48701 RepID=A0A3B3WY89_9TELE|nr:PREDICTED: fukutin isoform X1 [Poecilia formosa]XP_014827543.1 PREDICTED: fukutin isoform X1 [Poecilia mexicana]